MVTKTKALGMWLESDYNVPRVGLQVAIGWGWRGEKLAGREAEGYISLHTVFFCKAINHLNPQSSYLLHANEGILGLPLPVVPGCHEGH